MLKIENSSPIETNGRQGWYLDKVGDPWFFENDNPLVAFAGDSYPITEHFDPDDFEPFTRLTGKIIITNEE